MSRAEALERYNALPVPDTTEEHWRFTDLSGFDPDSFGHNRGQTPDVAVPSMLALDVAAEAVVTETGIEITRAPEEIRFEPLDESHERLGQLVGWQDDKFAAHNAAAWRHGLLVHVPAGLELERPLFVRVVNAIEGGSLFWRLLVIAEEGSRFSLVEEHSSASPELNGYFNNVAELFVEQAAKLEYVSLQNLSRETWHFASHHARVERDAELDWVSGGFGSKRGKVRIQNDLAGPGATSRVTGAYFGDGGLARDDPGGEGRAENQCVPGVPQPDALADDPCRPDPGPRDPGQRRPLHARRDGRPGRPRAALLPDGPRAAPPGGGAPGRARVLPGRARSHRA
jgi:Fe-S cluster assembly protein SufD